MIRYSRRPFPPYRHRPGKTPHPERDPRGHLAGRVEPPPRPLSPDDWSDNDDYLFAVDLFNAGYFWEAHVYWEKLWALEETDAAARSLLKGLIQLAAASLKRSEGAPAGARKLIEKSRVALGAVAGIPGGGTCFGVGVHRLLEAIDRDRLPRAIELELGLGDK